MKRRAFECRQLGWLLFGCLFSLGLPLLCAAPPPGFNYDEEKVQPYTLPDPLTCADGTKVVDPNLWRLKRRPEILELFTSQVFGRTPSPLPKPRFELLEEGSSALGGTATRKQVRIWLAGTNGGPSMDLLLYIPNHIKGRAPAFLGLNFGGNHSVTTDPAVLISTNWISPKFSSTKDSPSDAPTRGFRAERWPIEKIISNGFALITAYYGDLEPDFAEGWKDGVRGVFSRAGTNTVFGATDWGAISAWAWGLSRAMDYLETDPLIDPRKVAVIGHSRLGKTALWAGARDERFAVVISNDSGEGGAALARRNFGETVERINTSFPHWFCANYKNYNTNPAALPVDAHMLIALCAPRPVYVASAEQDLWADPRGEFLGLKGSEPVYKLFGLKGVGTAQMPPVNKPVADALGYHIRTGPHNITPYDWDQYLKFVSRHFASRGQK